MKVRVEVDELEYERLVRSAAPRVQVPLCEVEVTQRNGFLRRKFRARYAEVLGSAVAHQMGLPSGKPVVSIWLAPVEEDSDEHSE